MLVVVVAVVGVEIIVAVAAAAAAVVVEEDFLLERYVLGTETLCRPSIRATIAAPPLKCVISAQLRQIY